MPDKKDREEPVECKEAPSEEGRPLETASGNRVIARTDGFYSLRKMPSVKISDAEEVGKGKAETRVAGECKVEN